MNGVRKLKDIFADGDAITYRMIKHIKIWYSNVLKKIDVIWIGNFDGFLIFVCKLRTVAENEFNQGEPKYKSRSK